jgi:cell division protein ZapA
MLLMAGLLLADRTAGLEDKVREAEGRLAQAQAQLEQAPKQETVECVEVPVMPTEVIETMSGIAARVEAMADEVEGRAS